MPRDADASGKASAIALAVLSDLTTLSTERAAMPRERSILRACISTSNTGREDVPGGRAGGREDGRTGRQAGEAGFEPPSPIK